MFCCVLNIILNVSNNFIQHNIHSVACHFNFQERFSLLLSSLSVCTSSTPFLLSQSLMQSEQQQAFNELSRPRLGGRTLKKQLQHLCRVTCYRLLLLISV